MPNSHDIDPDVVTSVMRDKPRSKRQFSHVLPRKFRTWARRVFWVSAVPLYYVGIAAICYLADASKDLPSVETFWTQSRPVSIQIVDRNGQDIMVRGAKEATPVTLSTLSPHITQAVMAVEDRRFYSHAGIDPIGLARAMRANFKAGRVVQGGSTLSQQLAKNVFLTSDQTLRRKLQESLLAIWLERTFSKEEILEKYLNRIYFGGNAWGLEAASQQYFQKSASELGRGEAAVIAALLKGPSRYNPVSSPARAGERTALVLAAMERAKFITRKERRAALETPITVYRPQRYDGAGYFTEWIWPEIEAIIGTPHTDLIVRTTLDMNAQNLAKTSINTHLDPERGASQAALITLDGTGGVQAMIGGTDFGQTPFNRAVHASRQPGSAFKPFVYLTAFNAGLTPWDMRLDVPTSIGDWSPRNFTQKYLGEMSLETAFALSINTIAVQLSEEAGRERVVETAKALGLGELKPYRSLPLGAQNTTPLTLTAAYLPFANWGEAAQPYGVLSISTTNGTPIYDRPPAQRHKVIGSQALGHMNAIMTHAVEHGTGRRAQLPGRDVGGKTGTTNDYRDAWFIGYVPGLVTGVWVGADDNAPMKRITGGTIPASIWKDMMVEFTKELTISPLPISQPPVRAKSQNSLDILLADIETVLP